MENRVPAVRMSGITKTFGSVVANHDVSIEIQRGEILSLLGENGSGKTTLMNMLSGIYCPDSGQIEVDGKEVSIRSPKDALSLGIGMIHQHYKLVDVMNATQNIILGLKEDKYDLKAASGRVREICERYGFDLNPEQKVYDMTVSQKQTVEIVKVLYRKADILILDEPTAVLTPQETEKLFDVLRNMRNAGKSIIIITHKLNEVLEISDRVSVLRKGRYIGTVETRDATAESLTEMMVGEKVTLNIDRAEPVNVRPCLEVKNLNVRSADKTRLVLSDINFTANTGEILGIAGISGNGQKELLEAIVRLQNLESGEILFYPEPGECVSLQNKKSEEVTSLGIRMAFVPEDRLGMGLVGSMDIIDNMMLRSYAEGKSAIFTDRRTPKELAQKVVDKLEVVTPGLGTPVRRLSGGNVQKVLVGREIASAPKVLLVAYPVRGLDINSSYAIYNLLGEQKERGCAVVCVGEDLDVLIDLCDRILVLAGGQISGIVDARTTTKEELGILMTGGKE